LFFRAKYALWVIVEKRIVRDTFRQQLFGSYFSAATFLKDRQRWKVYSNHGRPQEKANWRGNFFLEIILQNLEAVLGAREGSLTWIFCIFFYKNNALLDIFRFKVKL